VVGPNLWWGRDLWWGEAPERAYNPREGYVRIRLPVLLGQKTRRAMAVRYTHGSARFIA
jgi:hypothetical protein